MSEIINILSPIHFIDMALIFFLTIPLFLIYVIYTITYFLKLDKRKFNTEGDYYTSNGLSRFCLAGIFFLFGLIIFDLGIEFISAYLSEYIANDYLETEIMEILKDSMVFNGLCKVFKAVPVNILINFTIVCTAIYTSTEGIIASLRTMKVESGLAVELPAIKRRRLSAMFILWCYISIIATIYTFLIGSQNVSFDLTNVYVSTGLTLIILFLAERSPSMLQDIESKSKLVKVANNVVSEYTEHDGKTINDPIYTNPMDKVSPTTNSVKETTFETPVVEEAKSDHVSSSDLKKFSFKLDADLNIGDK